MTKTRFLREPEGAKVTKSIWTGAATVGSGIHLQEYKTLKILLIRVKIQNMYPNRTIEDLHTFGCSPSNDDVVLLILQQQYGQAQGRRMSNRTSLADYSKFKLTTDNVVISLIESLSHRRCTCNNTPDPE